MGKSPKPLSILVHPELADTPEIRELSEKGHVIVVATHALTVGLALHDFDIILGPNCWRMDKDLLKYLDVAIKSARGIKYPKGKK